MNFQLKNIQLKVCIAIALLVTLAGCKKFLDTPRQGSYTADNYPYPGGAGPYDQFIFGAYDDLRNYWIASDGLITTTSIRSDDADKGDALTSGPIDMDDFTMNAAAGRFNLMWTSYYGLIDKCNSVLINIDTLRTINASEEIKQQSRAEARLMRGYAYFMLVRLYGKVPIIDTIYADPTAQQVVPQSSVEQVYAFVEDDLTFAAQYMPASWDKSTFAGRLTSGAANGLLAKVYLTQKKWAEASIAAQLVMNSGQYDLKTPYNDIFSEQGENSSESIIEFQATATATNTQGLGIQYASMQGLRGANEWNLGWGWNVPSAQLEAAYEPGDPRKARTILYASTNTTEGRTIYGEITPKYPSAVPYPRYNHKVLGSPSMRNSISRGSWWMNVRILRYADVVLMYAEAQNEMGNSGAALTALNSIRQRARGTASNVLPDITVTDQTELRNAIRHERRIELAMEHERFFDLVRWGIAAQVLQAAGKTNFVAGKHELLPIPQTQIDLSKGVLKQNPLY